MHMNFKKYLYKKKWLKLYKKNILNVKQKYEKQSLTKVFEFDTDIKLFSVTFYDTVTNKQLNKLIKKIYKLKRADNYKIEISYKQKKLKDLNYLKPQFDCTGGGGNAQVYLLKDNLLKSIDISWTQINNDEAILQYVCYFPNIIENFNFIHNLVIQNISKYKKIKYLPFYYNVDFFIKDDKEKVNLECTYFRCILQHKLENLFYSNYIKKYLLPIKYTYIAKNKNQKIMMYIKKPFLCNSYIIDNNHYLVEDSLEINRGCELNEFIFKQQFRELDLLHYFSYQRMNLYYNIFYNIEKLELEYKITKFLNSKKITINVLDYKWLLNKYRRINERRFYKIKEDRENTIKGFSDETISLSDPTLAINIKKVYNENIQYYNGINAINHNILAFILSIAAIVISVMQIFI